MSVLPAFARFWMVARKPDHAGARTEPKQRFPFRADARRAAAELADQNGAAFVILEAVEVVRPGDDAGGDLFGGAP